jgi:ligand-binding SRPBCC domain-containing protein
VRSVQSSFPAAAKENPLKVRTLNTEVWLPCPRDRVFAFFADVNNLDVITPPWLHFLILTPTVAVREGCLIEYRIRWRGVPLFWRTEVSAWEPPARFVDRQVKGPYRHWLHEHTFEEHDGGTLCRDRVEYAVPGWVVEPLLHRLLVGPDVVRIFEFRNQKLRELFGGPEC